MTVDRLRDLLGAMPLIQAPMAGAQGSAMALAVSGAGALGSIPAAMLSLGALRDELERMAASGVPYAVNFFAHTPPVADPVRAAAWRERLRPYHRELGIEDAPPGPGRAPFTEAAAVLLAEYRPAVVSFHFGLPSPELMAPLKAWGAVMMSSATTEREAVWLEQHGADVVIAQGYEAGGHRGCFLDEPHDESDLASQPGTFALVPQVVAAVRVPVVAAGGIADAAGVRAALALGASGVQVGTSYLCCDEALTSDLHRTALLSPEPQTVVTNVFTGRPARGIVNRFVCELGPLSSEVPAFPLATAASAPLRAAAEARGSSDFTPLWSGQNRTGCRRAPAAEVTLDLLQGFIGPV